ncbi:hypothetical protein BH688_05155 [Kushneria phosphatilytica]|nr:hypothetical protein BH688_05155 [Kushneria phosphatilytica]
MINWTSFFCKLFYLFYTCWQNAIRMRTSRVRIKFSNSAAQQHHIIRSIGKMSNLFLESITGAQIISIHSGHKIMTANGQTLIKCFSQPHILT